MMRQTYQEKYDSKIFLQCIILEEVRLKLTMYMILMFQIIVVSTFLRRHTTPLQHSQSDVVDVIRDGQADDITKSNIKELVLDDGSRILVIYS